MAATYMLVSVSFRTRESLLYALTVTCVGASAPARHWDAFNYAPTVEQCVRVLSRNFKEVSGSIENPQHLALNRNGRAMLVGNGALDWEIEVSTLIILEFSLYITCLISSNLDKVLRVSSIALSFTEVFISPVTSDDSSYPSGNQSCNSDLKVPTPLSAALWPQLAATLRGSIRYLTIVSTSDDPVTIANVTCAISSRLRWLFRRI